MKVPFFINIIRDGLLRCRNSYKRFKLLFFFFRKLNKQRSAFLTRATEKEKKKCLPNRYIISRKKLLSLLSNLLQKEHIQKDNIQAMKLN